MKRLIVVLGVLSLLLAGCSSGEPFVAGEDDLCEWVTEEEIAQATREAYESLGEEWDGTATLERLGGWDCVWVLNEDGGTEEDSNGVIQVEVVEGVEVDAREIIEYPEGDPWSSDFVSGVPGLGDDILVGPRWGFMFMVIGSDEAIHIWIGLDAPDFVVSELDEPTIIVASAILEELNWKS